MEERDMLYKDKMKRSGLNIKEHNFIKENGDVHEPVFCTVIIVSGRSTTGRRVTDGTTICRDSSHLKLVDAIMHENEARVWEKMCGRHQKTRLKV
ncbi:hypothetical protein P5673_010421 [Acropora cervicornis]|uniref:Uncharacterized protein n=1 Tax=Acropora cervicornis TaxID=6130 RepID=A0AAD9QRL9_ACRCE|nr:hypothetical protein P5673_010421 [Acropora cervicornis]